MDRLTPREERVAERHHPRWLAVALPNLTLRELDVLHARCGDEEHTIEGAAAVLGVHRKTLQNIGTRIIAKLGVVSFNGACRVYGEEKRSGHLAACATLRAETV